MSDKYKITKEEINKSILYSPYALPDSPKEKGLGASQVKKYFYEHIRFLAERLNIHLGDIAKDFKTMEESIEALDGKTELLEERDLELDAAIFDRLSEHNENSKAHQSLLQKAIDYVQIHNGDSLAHPETISSLFELREMVQLALNMAEAKSRVYPVETFDKMLEIIKDKNEGDMFIIAEENVPDFVLFKKDTYYYSNDICFNLGDEVELLPSRMYYLNDLKIRFLAVENGMDTSKLATKGQLDDLEQYLKSVDALVAGNTSLISGLDKRVEEIENKEDEVFEKIATVTVAPDTDGSLPNEIAFTLDEDNKEFFLSDFYIKAKIGVTDTEAKFRVYVNNTLPLMGNFKLGGILSTDLRNWELSCHTFGNNMGGIAIAPNSSVAITTSFPNINLYNYLITAIPPNKARYDRFYGVSLLLASGTFIEGSSVELWGKRK